MICVSIADLTLDEVLAAINRERLVELRLDRLEDLDPGRVCAGNTNVIATYRPKDGVSDKERLTVLGEFIRAGVGYVDIELDSAESYHRELQSLAAKYGCKVVLSYHNFEATPPTQELLNIVSHAQSLGPSVVKVACQVHSAQDACKLLGLLAHWNNLVIVGMGQEGKLIRVVAPLFGSPFTFASLDDAHATAPGQLSVSQMREIYSNLSRLGLTSNRNQ